MTTKSDGGPAFPHGPLGDTMTGEDGRTWHQWPGTAGMSLRDWFAGQALVGAIAHSGQLGWDDASVKEAYQVADAMLKEREKGQQ